MLRNLILHELSPSIQNSPPLQPALPAGQSAMTDRSMAPNTPSVDGFPMLDPRDAPTLSLLGHDLRAALSEVVVGLRLVDTAAMDAENGLKIARTRAAAEALSLLLEQALSIMLFDTRQSISNQGLLQTKRLLDSIRLRWQGRAQDAGLAFHLDATDLPPQLRMDPALLERVLSNLLGNALKFAGAGTVTCRIGLIADRLTITVSDEGPGFPENALPRLFQVYSRPENTSKPGTGLGLHIVRDMVDRAGGTITARNRPEGGAEVAIDLPLPDQSDVPALANPPMAAPDLRRCRVLVADDTATNRMILQQFLTEMGAEVVFANDGVEAIGRLERESFDLLLIDIEMPRMTGLDVIGHLRAMPGPVALLPVLAITAHATDVRLAAIIGAGANATLSKPVTSPVALGMAVTRAMAPRHTQTATDAAAAADAARAIDVTQFENLLQLAGPATAAELIDRFLEDLLLAERRLTAAQVGPNWAAIGAQTHVLIALAGTAGGHHLQGLAEELNQLAHADAPRHLALQPLFNDTLAALQTMIRFVAGKVGQGRADR